MSFYLFKNTEDLERENDFLKEQVEMLSAEPEVRLFFRVLKSIRCQRAHYLRGKVLVSMLIMI